MRRAPAKPVRACTLRKWCPLSHVTFEAPLRTSHSTLHTSHYTLRTSHSTLHTSQSTLHTWNFTVHTSHFTVHTSHFTVHTSHFSLLTASFTLQTSHFTLHSSHPTLHLIWALLTLSQLSSSHLISSHMSSTLSLPSTTTHDDFEALFKRIFKRKITSAKIAKICWQITIAAWNSHSNTIYDIQLQKTIVLRMQPRHRATLTQPLQCDLQRLSCKTQ